jgi:hypothetical protein
MTSDAKRGVIMPLENFCYAESRVTVDLALSKVAIFFFFLGVGCLIVVFPRYPAHRTHYKLHQVL